MGADFSNFLNTSKRAKIGEVWSFNNNQKLCLILGIYIDEAYEGFVFDCLNLETGVRDITPWSIDYDERWTRLD